MNAFNLAKEFLSSRRYTVLDEDSSSGRISFRFQLNTIHFWVNPDDEQFFFLTLPNFTDVTGDNILRVKENCLRVNKEVKLVKLYLLNDVILAAAELYYLAQADFDFQFSKALKHLISAKVMYKKLDEQ